MLTITTDVAFCYHHNDCHQHHHHPEDQAHSRLTILNVYWLTIANISWWCTTCQTLYYEVVTITIPFEKGRNWPSERLRNLLRVTQLGSNRAEIGAQAVRLQSLSPYPPDTLFLNKVTVGTFLEIQWLGLRAQSLIRELWSRMMHEAWRGEKKKEEQWNWGWEISHEPKISTHELHLKTMKRNYMPELACRGKLLETHLWHKGLR